MTIHSFSEVSEAQVDRVCFACRREGWNLVQQVETYVLCCVKCKKKRVKQNDFRFMYKYVCSYICAWRCPCLPTHEHLNPAPRSMPTARLSSCIARVAYVYVDQDVFPISTSMLIFIRRFQPCAVSVNFGFLLFGRLHSDYV